MFSKCFDKQNFSSVLTAATLILLDGWLLTRVPNLEARAGAPPATMSAIGNGMIAGFCWVVMLIGQVMPYFIVYYEEALALAFPVGHLGRSGWSASPVPLRCSEDLA